MNSDSHRLLLAFVLTFGFLFIWSSYIAPKPTPPSPIATAPNESATPVEKEAAPAKVIASSNILPAKVPVAMKSHVLANEEIRAVFTNKGAGPSRIELLSYLESRDDQAKPVSVLPIEEAADSPFLWDLSLRPAQNPTSSIALDDKDLVYRVIQESEREIVYQTDLAKGVQVQKKYKLSDQPFVIEHTLEIRNQTQEVFAIDAKTSISAAETEKSSGGFSLQPAPQGIAGVAYAHADEFHWTKKDFTKGKTSIAEGPIDWAGFASQYFLLTAIPVEGMWKSLDGKNSENLEHLSMAYPERNLAANSNISYSLKLYAGPKKLELLSTVSPTLNRAVDLGSWLGGLSRLIHKMLEVIYSKIPNYGLAIIILTIAVRLIVFPLVQYQARSMKKLASHQPAMNALKAKFENDREAQSRELMNYMRTHKINPAGGCLPLLIQLPIFIALYRVLSNAVELRHAPFALWIQDLSAYDPFFVLPVLVGVTFYLQTRLNPTPMADPAQATMMKIMPVAFSIFMIFLPSGLNLYIFISTLWGIVQQYVVQKQLT